MILVSFSRILNGLSHEINLFWRCSSPLSLFRQCRNRATRQSGKGRQQAQLKCVHIKGRNCQENINHEFWRKICFVPITSAAPKVSMTASKLVPRKEKIGSKRGFKIVSNRLSILMYQSIPSLTIPPGDSHILIAPGVGFSLLCLAQGVLNQSKSSIILKKCNFCFVS